MCVRVRVRGELERVCVNELKKKKRERDFSYSKVVFLLSGPALIKMKARPNKLDSKT